MDPLVVLSPHLDDAALSCGGRIAHASAAGRRVIVATLFTRDEPREPPSRFAAELRLRWKLPPGEAMRRRREEDLEACRRLGAEARHLDLPEALDRTDARGRVLYGDLAALYGEVAPEDRAWQEEVAERIRALLAEEPGEPELLGPLGVGHHVDHLLVREALAEVAPGAALYEEFPYNEWKWFAVRGALGRPGRWRSESLPLPEPLLERRLAAILAYESQVPAMFRTEGRLRKQLRRASRRGGGERIWRRR
jgi:LmbE family N-acetylglucosaminyl deacetylase